MCGISAIFKYTSIKDSDVQALVRMNQEMKYRGPDDEGIWSNDLCGLAQTRLSIIGLDNGHQPLFNEDRSLVLVCNGEIYNHIELRRDLEAKGHRFASDTDSETILHLYEEYDVKCLDHLRGMFAFCLFDTLKKRLFAARDRIGEKLLYYAMFPEGIAVSTELKAIRKHVLKKWDIDTKVLAECIRFNFPVDVKNTWVDEIKRLRAGEYLLQDVNGPEVHRYWNREGVPAFTDGAEDAKKEILKTLRQSVDLCLRSDVPVAVLLSSGIDSCAIAALARESGREIHTITAGYAGSHDCDEREPARRFARDIGSVHHEIELDAGDFHNIFYEYSRYLDEPVCDVSSMSQWALYKKAKALGFTVLLSGIGGDELFYGYPYYNELGESLQVASQHKSLLPWNTMQKKTEFVRFFLKHWRTVIQAGYPLKLDDQVPVHWTYDDYRKFAESAELDFRGTNSRFRDIDVHRPFGSEAGLKEVYDFMFSTFMTTLCLYLADREGMGNAVEVRAPLLDYKLVEFVASLPEHIKYVRGKPKQFLQETLRGLLPDYILNSPKKGFTPPISFIDNIAGNYKYNVIRARHTFFNSMLTDQILFNALDSSGKNG